jgi:hypothetical protein
MGTVTLTTEEYEELIRTGSLRKSGRKPRASSPGPRRTARKASAYSKRYGAAFKRIAPKNKKKNGGWKQGGFTRTQKAAHRAARKK